MKMPYILILKEMFEVPPDLHFECMVNFCLIKIAIDYCDPVFKVVALLLNHRENLPYAADCVTKHDGSN
jgi:hypothetical protein